MRAVKQRLKASRSRLRDVDLGDMTVFGVWASAAAVVQDVGDATKCRRCDPADTLGALIGSMERAYFIVRIAVPPPAAAAGGASVLGWLHVGRLNFHCVCSYALPLPCITSCAEGALAVLSAIAALPTRIAELIASREDSR